MPQSMGELEYDQQPRNQERLHKKKEKKWTLGSLFRRKKAKDSDTDSTDSDAAEDGKKGGFLARRRRRRAANRGSKDVSQSFEHVILRPTTGGQVGVDGKKSLKARVEASRDSLLKDSSSDEECSPRTKPRAPRSKRSSRDMTDCNMKVMELDSSPRSPRWTAKVVYCESSDYEARYTAHTRSATPSPAQSPIAKVKHLKRPPIPQSNAPRPLQCQKSASFDILPRQNQLYHHPPHHPHHQPQLHPRIPPPPPPRDPQRKIIPPLGYQLDRPLSYAFESNQPLPKVMTDHNSNITAYKVNSSCSLDQQPVYKMNSSNSLDHKRTYQYYTDQQPRSRRPIHIARVDQPYLSDSQVGRIRMSDWRIPRDSNSSLYDSSDSREGGPDVRPLSMVMETTEQQPQQPEFSEKKDQKRKSSNLEDALNELEAIYKSLQMRDEEPPLRGFESDSGCYRVVDDMAYRRLNRKESGGSPDFRRVMSQAGSYLLVSPTLSPPPFANAPPIPPPQNEPDVTLDDVVYRNIRHTNNTLKVADPQPPFGIPLGPVAPAPSSDYLHATPKQLYRPTFKPRKTPDIVKDDLAYRNLRKDGQQDSLLSTEDGLLNENPSILKKKRAVRSLSANLLSIIQKEQFRIENQNNKNFNCDIDNFEKTQSYSDLPDIIDTRYKRSYSTEDSDVTPRVSRFYPDLPISTTSTETLTDSRANIMNAQEFCSNRNQCLPLSNKPLPKTDFAKLRLPSPSPQQNSSPKKFLQNLDSSNSQHNAAKSQNSSNNQFVSGSSPNNSLKMKTSLDYRERNNSKSPSPYYLATETTEMMDGNKYISAYYPEENKVNKNNTASVCRPASREINHEHNRVLSPSACRRSFDSMQTRDNVTSETNHFFNGDYGKLNCLNAQTNENRRCVSQSPKIDDQLLKNETSKKNLECSTNIDHLEARSFDKMKNNPEVKSPTQSAVNDSLSFTNYRTFTSQEDYVADLQPVPLNPPKISIKQIIPKEDPKSSAALIPPNTRSATDSVSSSNSNNFVGPKVSENKISIEGIKLVIPSEKTSSLGRGSGRTSSLLKQSTEQDQQNAVSVATSSADINKPRIPSPRMNVSHDKFHQKIDTKAYSHLTPPVEISNNDCKKKVVVPRPQSSINIENSSLEKHITVSPRPRSSLTNDRNGIKPRVPSPCLYLNAEKHVLDDRVKSKSSSPRLSVESNKSRLPSPRLSVTPEKSPVHERSTNSGSSVGIDLMSTKENISNDCSTPVTSVNLMKMQNSGQSLNPYDSLDTIKGDKKITSQPLHSDDSNTVSCSNKSAKIIVNETVRTAVPDDLKENKELNENVSSDSGAKYSANEIDNASSLSSVLEEKSQSFDKLSSDDKKDDHTKVKTYGSALRVEKDIDELLSEINVKQGEILSGKNKSNSISDISSNNDKKDCLVLGKITPHKPVKLTTFSINDNNTIENNETIIVPNRENDIIGTSESMTDLLKELTRSLDQDFGCLTMRGNYNQGGTAEDESEIERTISSGSFEQTKSLEEKRQLENSKSIDSQELNNTDEADNEVMEINRVVLEQNENKSDVRNINNDNLTGFVAVKGKQSQTIGIKKDVISEQCKSEQFDKEVVVCQAGANGVQDKQGYHSDDSNAEFVEAICKTASELSALSSTSKATTSTSGMVSSSQPLISTDSTAGSSLMTERVRWNRPPQSQGSNLDQNEGERS